MTDEGNKPSKPGFFSAATKRLTTPSDSKTRKITEAEGETVDLGRETREVPEKPKSASASSAAPKGGASTPSLSGRTRLAGPRARSSSAAGAGSSENKDVESSAADFVVGWLVILRGPGMGRSLSLGYGLNTIGREPDQRVCLDFGDMSISRSSHCSIAYDQRNRQFSILHGGGQNLTYLGDEPVFEPKPLSAGAEILVGDTLLGFVPLCGPEFDWDDIPSADGASE
ncbi:MAG: FHA domain-containing protein [Pseudomonadota bacterium]